VLAASGLRAQGSTCQTEDPVPVDFHHDEVYIFSGMDRSTAGIDAMGLAFDK
jgi:hypothetical protein